VKVALGAGTSAPVYIGSSQIDTDFGPWSAVIDKPNQYSFWGLQSGRIVKVALGNGTSLPTRVGATAPLGYIFRAAVIDQPNGFTYWGADASPARIFKVAVGSGSSPPYLVASLQLSTGDNSIYSAAIDPSGGFAYFGMYTSPGTIVKVALGSGSSAPIRVVSITGGPKPLLAAVFDGKTGYSHWGGAGLGAIPVVSKVANGTARTLSPSTGTV